MKGAIKARVETGWRRATDGILFQAALTGALSFRHIHDLAAMHGQGGWPAWMYPPSVDLLTVAGYRKVMSNRRKGGKGGGLSWITFLTGNAVSIAANVASAWGQPDRAVAIPVGVWPAVAFLLCTLLAHDPEPAAKAAEPAAEPVVEAAPAEPGPVTVPQPISTHSVVKVPRSHRRPKYAEGLRAKYEANVAAATTDDDRDFWSNLLAELPA